MLTPEETSRLRRAASDPDRYAVELTYQDALGTWTRRRCSPIRRSTNGWLVMCFASGAPRLLSHSKISNVKLIAASDCIIPTRKQTLPQP